MRLTLKITTDQNQNPRAFSILTNQVKRIPLRGDCKNINNDK